MNTLRKEKQAKRIIEGLFQDSYLEDLATPTDSTSSQGELYQERIISGKKVYSCLVESCGKTFKYKCEIKRHSIIHLPDRPYECLLPGCGKTFKRRDALSDHSRIHTKQNTFECPIAECSGLFGTKSSLRRHLLNHSGEKVFKRNHLGCAKSFLPNGQLRENEELLSYNKKVSMMSPFQDDLLSSQLHSLSPTELDFFEDKEILVDNNNSMTHHNSEVPSSCIGLEETMMMNSFAKYETQTYLHDYSDNKYKEDISTETSELASPERIPNRSPQDQLLSLLRYAIEENNQLRKKLKSTADTLESNTIPQVQLKGQSQDHEDNNADSFFNSSFEAEFGDQETKAFGNIFSDFNFDLGFDFDFKQ
jgi:hypothetical protein